MTTPRGLCLIALHCFPLLRAADVPSVILRPVPSGMQGYGAERQHLGTCHLAGVYDQKKNVTSHTIRPVAPLISQSDSLRSPLMGGSREESCVPVMYKTHQNRALTAWSVFSLPLSRH